MSESASEKVLAQLSVAEQLYHRLILLVAPSGSGKSRALREIAENTEAPVKNVNLEVSMRLLELTERQRALELPRVLEEILGENAPLVLLDNIEILFDVSLEQDPLRLLQGLSRNRTIVAAWNGAVDASRLVYAEPEHPEYRRYSTEDLMIVQVEKAA